HGAVALHKSLGITVFALTLLRIVWRLGHRAPPLPATTPGWQRAAAHGAHMLLYGFLLAMPLTGYVFGSGGPYPMEWFGVEIPKAPVPKPVAETAHDAHVVGGYAVAVMVVVHIGAACWHQWVQRDNLIARMSLVRRAG
ncbi:MAG: cytochrome b, partial [Sphingomonadales bacterium]|nr:cytochrome b [Sphingomonadales bacterium]